MFKKLAQSLYTSTSLNICKIFYYIGHDRADRVKYRKDKIKENHALQYEQADVSDQINIQNL